MLRGNTNWNLYKTFVVVYENKNLSKASKILRITSTAVGQNIKELGRQLGVALFTSHSKGVEPTKEATDIYPTIKNAIELILATEARVSKFCDKNKVTIKVAILSVSARILVQDYLKNFHAKHPEIKLEIAGLDAADFISQKQQNLVIATKRRINQDLKVKNLYTIKTAFFATKDFLKKHEMSNTISKEQLYSLPLIVRKEETGIDLKKCSSSLHLITSSDTIYSMIKDSIGVGLIGKETLELLGGANDADLVALNVHDMTPSTIQIVCGYNGTLTKPMRTFINDFSKFCKERFS